MVGSAESEKGVLIGETGDADETFIRLTHAFTRKQIQRSHWHLLILSLVSVYLVVATLFALDYASSPVPVISFSTNSANEVARITANRDPKITELQAINWAENKSTQLLSLHFNNFRKQIAARSNLFTQDGFIKYKTVLNDLKTAPFIIKNSLIITAVVSDVPFLDSIFSRDGRKNWRLEIPVKQTIYGANDTPRTKSLLVSITIEEAERSEVLSGLKIRTFNVKGN